MFLEGQCPVSSPRVHTCWRTCHYRQGRLLLLLIRFISVAQAAQIPGQKLMVQIPGTPLYQMRFYVQDHTSHLGRDSFVRSKPPKCWVGIGMEGLLPKSPPVSFSLRTRIFFPVLTLTNCVLQSHSSPRYSFLRNCEFLVGAVA